MTQVAVKKTPNRAILTSVLLMLWGQTLFAKDLFKLGTWDGGLSGSFKSIASVQNLRQRRFLTHDTQYSIENRLRIMGGMTRQWFHLEFADELQFFLQGSNPEKIPLPDLEAKNPWDSRNVLVDEELIRIRNRVDRAFVRIGNNQMTLTVGKQLIPTGVGHLFNAVSQVPRRPFVQVDPEYPQTEDAVAFVWNGSLSLEARFLPGIGDQLFHNFHFRAKGTKSLFDMALTAGRSDDKPYVGVEIAGNLGDSLVRGEVVAYDYNNQDVIQALAGFDTVFSRVLSADFELFFNGFGTRGNYVLAPAVHRSTPYLGRWYAGTRVRWDISAILYLSLYGVINIEDTSALLLLSGVYSLSDNSDLILGQYLSVASSSRSEFGGTLEGPSGVALGLPDITYLLYRWYF